MFSELQNDKWFLRTPKSAGSKPDLVGSEERVSSDLYGAMTEDQREKDLAVDVSMDRRRARPTAPPFPILSPVETSEYRCHLLERTREKRRCKLFPSLGRMKPFNKNCLALLSLLIHICSCYSVCLFAKGNLY